MTAQVEISAMTFGPYALARMNGQAVMVPNAAPGDRLEIEIVARRRGFATARIVRIIAPGPYRRPPPCPYLPRCGGCDWQHLEYPAQLSAKAGLIAAALAHALDITIDPERLMEPAPAELRYRSRIRLKIGSRGRLGFHELGSNTLVEIDECLVAETGLRIPREFARELGGNLDEVEVAHTVDGDVVVGWMRNPPTAAEVERVRRALGGASGVKGAILRSGKRREVIGEVGLVVAVEPGMELAADADLFTQINHAQNRKLVAAVMEMAAIERGTGLLDLFCGVGNLSLPAARRGADVTGVDADELAIATATQNAVRMKFERAQFIAMKAADTARFLLRAGYHPQVVILDPPRIGAAELMDPVAKLKPRSVVYVSCDVSTLARDLRALVAEGYRIERIRAFDFFPNTHHAELVAHLLLT